ncbi:MAG: hypothetical protein H6Q91_912, partial [Deltaproteobacteria bacterium]|nr:hypothetical protein [Deltaproteobacteria bacterium]
VPTLGPSRRSDEIRLRPVLELAARDAQDPDDLTRAEQARSAGIGFSGDDR